MFPAILVQPEVSYSGFIIGAMVLGFGHLLGYFKKIILALSFALLTLVPSYSFGMMAAPGVCGSSCMMMGGMWGGNMMYPGVYMWPQMYNPWAFYQNQMLYYSMMSPWYGMGSGYPYRGFSSVSEPEPSKTPASSDSGEMLPPAPADNSTPAETPNSEQPPVVSE